MDYQALPLFSKLFYLKKLNIDTKRIISRIQEPFIESGYQKENNVENIAGASKSKTVLNKPEYKDLRDLVLNEFYFFSKEVLQYSNKFDITTSWFTRTEKGQSSNYHNHHNSMYSGILYLQTDDNSGNISFEDYSNHKRFLCDPIKWNIYNSSEYKFKPVDCLLIFFPSEIYHKILKNNSDIIRVSLAFNFLPVGKVGHGDSEMNIKLI